MVASMGRGSFVSCRARVKALAGDSRKPYKQSRIGLRKYKALVAPAPLHPAPPPVYSLRAVSSGASSGLCLGGKLETFALGGAFERRLRFPAWFSQRTTLCNALPRDTSNHYNLHLTALRARVDCLAGLSRSG